MIWCRFQKDAAVADGIEMRAALSDPELMQRYTELGLEPLQTSPDDLSGRLRAEIDKWRRVIREAGIEQQ